MDRVESFENQTLATLQAGFSVDFKGKLLATISNHNPDSYVYLYWPEASAAPDRV